MRQAFPATATERAWAVQENAAMPINPVVHELGELQFHHPDHIDPLPHVPHNANVPEEHNLMEEVPFQLPAPHHLGDMTDMCPHCQARYFQDETTTQRVFTKCCFQGKVSLPAIQVPSQTVVQLFTADTPQSRHFLENIRHYNAVLSMASWNATLREHAGMGPRVITIHGQPYHMTSAQEAPDGHPPQYAQLCILDTNKALQQRINDPRNTNLRPDVIQLLQDELLALNPYARQYKSMDQILWRERETAAANNQPVQPVRMIIATRPFQDQRYANPTTTEIAAVYVGHDGAAPNPSDRDLEVNILHNSLDTDISHIFQESFKLQLGGHTPFKSWLGGSTPRPPLLHHCIHILYRYSSDYHAIEI